MHLGQFSASVSVDGVELPEYAVEYSGDGTQATCWIPSENDKQFRVTFKNTDAKPTHSISGRVLVDGIKCGGKGMHILRNTPHISVGARDSVATSANTRRPLTFSKQALTDDDEYLNNAISPDLGTIKVVLSHVKPVRVGREWSGVGLHFEPQVLHERSKKAIGHSVQFGQEFQSGINRQCKLGTLKNLVTFIFKYRPIGLLRAEGIAPSAPREARAVTPVDVLDLSMDVDTDEDGADDHQAKIKELEMASKEIEARLEALKNKKKRVKRELSEVKKEIKSEEPIFKPGEVIDLT